ncbi:hypothetical protein [Methylophaga sp.]
MTRKWLLASALVVIFSLTACHGHLHHKVPPGHDPDGPGNSENAPGHE